MRTLLILTLLIGGYANATKLKPPPDDGVDIDLNVGVHVRGDQLNKVVTGDQQAVAKSRSDSSSRSSSESVSKSRSDSKSSVTGVTATTGPIEFNPDIDAGGDIDVKGSDLTIEGSTSVYREAASTAVAGYGNTTASCFRTYGIGWTSTDNAISLGWPWKDGECMLGEDAALAFLMGNETIGWKMYCSQRSVLRVYGMSRWFGRGKKDAHTLCVADSTKVTLTTEQIALMIGQVRDRFQDAHGDRIYSELNSLIERVTELEKHSHPQGKGLSVERVREIAREEAPCGTEQWCPTEDK